jgi:hypothetical protein
VHELQAALARATVTSMATSAQPERSHVAPAVIAYKYVERRPRNVRWNCNQPGHWARHYKAGTAHSTVMNTNSDTVRTHADVFHRQFDAMMTRPVLQDPATLPASALQTDYQDFVSID